MNLHCKVSICTRLNWMWNWFMSVSPTSPPHASSPSFPAVMRPSLSAAAVINNVFFYTYTKLMCLIIRWLINWHIAVCSVCLCLPYACFNMPLIIGAVMCSFITPIIMKHSLCAAGVCVLSFQQVTVFSQDVHAFGIFIFHKATFAQNYDFFVWVFSLHKTCNCF